MLNIIKCYVDYNGNILEPHNLNIQKLYDFYYYMALTRAFDQKAINLQRTGRLGTFPSSYGQEALFVATGMAIDKDDSYCPYYRDQGALLARGANMARIFSYWGGYELGNNLENNVFDLPITVPIASQTMHATGLAYAFKYQEQAKLVLCSMGDGATSKGEFYESLNMCAIHKLPVLFVINDNNYAISTPLSQQTAEIDLSRKGLSFGVPGYIVDGSDIIAVYKATKKLREYCLQNGPAILVAKTYRLHDHTTADDASKYLNKDYVITGKKLDPLLRFEKILPKEKLDHIHKEVSLKIEHSVSEYLSTHDSKSPFLDTFASMPSCLQQQKNICEHYND